MDSDDSRSFGPPPFKPAEAAQSLARELRALRLVDRAGGFEVNGRRVIEVQVDDKTIQARLAKRPSQRTPEWTSHALKSSADVRDFLATVRRQLTRWNSSDE